MKKEAKRWCFFCDGWVSDNPHHCPLTGGVELTYVNRKESEESTVSWSRLFSLYEEE